MKEKIFMKHIFTDYYLFEQFRPNSALTVVAKYGNYAFFENGQFSTLRLSLGELQGLYLFNSETGKIKLKNAFGEDLAFRVWQENSQDEIFGIMNKSMNRFEFFINNHLKKSAPIIFNLISDQELIAEVDLMRIRAFSLS